MTHHGVEDEQQLVHAGGQGELLGLADGMQAGREVPNDGVMAGGDERGHVVAMERTVRTRARPPHTRRRPRQLPLAQLRATVLSVKWRAATAATGCGRAAPHGGW
jgi:hypothetical protein